MDAPPSPDTAFAGSIANGYLCPQNIAVQLLGYTISLRLLGVRAIVQIVVCMVFFYFGYLKPRPQSA